MEYTLKNGATVTIRPPTPADAQGMVDLLTRADTESPFLMREPGEFTFTVEQEAAYIQSVREDPNQQWYAAFLGERLIGQSSVGLVNGKRQRCRHRAALGFVVQKEFWGLGVGSHLMENCLAWCKEHGVEQAELEVVANNNRAVHMYEGFGFEATGTRPRALKYPDGSYADCLIMTKFL